MKIPIGGICEPGSTLVNKTGGWRNFRPVYNYEKCTKCGICEIVCPDMSILPEKMVFSNTTTITAKDAVSVRMNALQTQLI